MSSAAIAATSTRSDSTVLIIGSGPAGCSCALWLAQMGLRVVLIDREARLLPRLYDLDLKQDWVLGQPETSTRELALRYAAHVQAQPLVDVRCGVQLKEVRSCGPGSFDLLLSDGQTVHAAAIVLATGLRPVPPPAWVAPTAACLDAARLTVEQSSWPPGQRVLLLGGGDNAVENAHSLCNRGHRVTLWSRGPLRAQERLVQQLERHRGPGLTLRIGEAMPVSVAMSDEHDHVVQSVQHGREVFDRVAVLFGYVPDPSAWEQLRAACGFGFPANDLASLAKHAIFMTGDASQRLHPSISTAVGDGVQTAKAVHNWLTPSSRGAGRGDLPQTSNSMQTLSITGLRFDANLGILDHEKTSPQPIQVDAELNLGAQPLSPQDDEIMHVLDYRKVRRIIIEECTAEHVNLLESLIGKLAQRLMHLPGVIGVRVRIAKLEIFDDCEVAIRVETGLW